MSLAQKDERSQNGFGGGDHTEEHTIDGSLTIF